MLTEKQKLVKKEFELDAQVKAYKEEGDNGSAEFVEGQLRHIQSRLYGWRFMREIYLKEEAVDGFLTDLHGEGVAKAAEGQLKQLLTEKQEIKGLLARINQKIAGLLNQSTKLTDKQDHARRIVWNPISEALMDKIHNEICDKVWFACHVNRQKVYPLKFERFLLEVFPKPNQQQLNEFNSKLNNVFQKEVNS